MSLRVAVALVAALAIASCGGNPRLEGKWRLVRSNVDEALVRGAGGAWTALEFRGDRMILRDGIRLKYEERDGQLSLSAPGHSSSAALAWRGDTLVITHAGSLTLVYEYLRER